jgi:hypothetical protein
MKLSTNTMLLEATEKFVDLPFNVLVVVWYRALTLV